MDHLPTNFKTPGQLIEWLLAERGWTKKVLGIVLEIDEAGLSRIISGKRPLSAELAVALEEVFEVPAESLMALQKSFELAQARIAAQPDPKRATRAKLFGGLPVNEMIKRGWLLAENPKDIPAVEKALHDFFHVESSEAIEALPHAAKKADALSDSTLVQIAWMHRVRQIASEMLVPRFSVDSAKAAVKKLTPLLSAVEETRKVPKILAEAGIRYVIVETLPTAKIDGICMWLNDASPVIGMSIRYDRIDNFWFVLRHELEHVIRGDGKITPIIDAELEGERAGTSASIPEAERIANGAAAEFCVPSKSMDSFILRKAPFFAERDLLGFAKTLGIHPGLVAGQLQHKTGRHDRFRAHQVKVRSNVAPSAVVDGWGDIAPVDI